MQAMSFRSPHDRKRRQAALDSGKRVSSFAISTLSKVDSARRVTLLPGTTFLYIPVNGPLMHGALYSVVELCTIIFSLFASIVSNLLPIIN